MSSIIRVSIISIAAVCFSSAAWAVDPALQPPSDSTSQVANVYHDMIVVQRKAKEKAHKILLGAYAEMEYSDGPQSISSLNFEGGYAFSNEFELYASVAPAFIAIDQPIKSQVQSLQLANGEQAQLISPSRSLMIGVEGLWLPMYGKDSWGPHHIIRSDTFLKVYGGMIMYSSQSGIRVAVSLGKTFYMNKYFNPRVSGGIGVQQTIVNNDEATSQVGLFEFGSVAYF